MEKKERKVIDEHVETVEGENAEKKKKEKLLKKKYIKKREKKSIWGKLWLVYMHEKKNYTGKNEGGESIIYVSLKGVAGLVWSLWMEGACDLTCFNFYFQGI